MEKIRWLMAGVELAKLTEPIKKGQFFGLRDVTRAGLSPPEMTRQERGTIEATVYYE